MLMLITSHYQNISNKKINFALAILVILGKKKTKEKFWKSAIVVKKQLGWIGRFLKIS